MMPNMPDTSKLIQKILRAWAEATQREVQKFMREMEESMRKAMDPKVLEDMMKKFGMGIPTGSIPGFDPYLVLRLEKTATDEEVKSRYRELLHHLHPDTAGVHGTEFVLQMVTMAYEMIEKERGWRK